MINDDNCLATRTRCLLCMRSMFATQSNCSNIHLQWISKVYATFHFLVFIASRPEMKIH